MRTIYKVLKLFDGHFYLNNVFPPITIEYKKRCLVSRMLKLTNVQEYKNIWVYHKFHYKYYKYESTPISVVQLARRKYFTAHKQNGMVEI